MRLWKAKQDSPCNVVEGFLPDFTSQRSLSNICHPYSWFKNHGIIFTLFRFWHLQKRHPYQQRYFFETTESPLHGLGLWTNKQRPLWASLWFLFPPCVCRRISVDERARDRAGPCPWCWTPPHSSYKLLGLLPAYSLSDSFELCFFLSLPVWFCCHGYISDPHCLPEMPVPVVEGGGEMGMDCLRQRELSVGIFSEHRTVS